MSKSSSEALILAQNLRTLLDRNGWSARECSRRTSDPTVSPKTITTMLTAVGSSTVDKVDAVARTFSLRAWHLLAPDLISDPSTGGRVLRLVKAYSSASDQGKRHIERVAEREAEFQQAGRGGAGGDEGKDGDDTMQRVRPLDQPDGEELPELRIY